MLLAIDVGNTNTVFAVLEGGILRGEWRSATKDMRTADEYVVWLTQLMGLEGLEPKDIDGAIISTVVPQVMFDLRQLCRRYFNLEAIVIGDPGVDLGIDINVLRPEQVGADRLVNAVAAHHEFKGDLIVVDFGTATTLDVVSATGAYEGGIICPGVNLSLEALKDAAAKLPHVGIQRPQRVIGSDTISAMQSGVYWGYISLIEGLVARIREEYGKPMSVVSTGGLGHLFRHGTPVIEYFDPELTIRGLLRIYEHNARLRATA